MNNNSVEMVFSWLIIFFVFMFVIMSGLFINRTSRLNSFKAQVNPIIEKYGGDSNEAVYGGENAQQAIQKVSNRFQKKSSMISFSVEPVNHPSQSNSVNKFKPSASNDDEDTNSNEDTNSKVASYGQTIKYRIHVHIGFRIPFTNHHPLDEAPEFVATSKVGTETNSEGSGHNDPQSEKGTINVNYKNTDGKLLNSYSVRGNDGSSFDLDYYRNQKIDGYLFQKVENPVTKFNRGTQNVDIILKPNQPDTFNSNIYVSYVDTDTGGQIGGMKTSTGLPNTFFDVSPYLNNIPNGYDLSGIDNQPETYTFTDQYVRIYLKKVRTASNIHVRYVNDDSGQLIDEEDIHGHDGDNFDISPYLMKAFAGYNYQGTLNNDWIDRFSSQDQSITVNEDPMQAMPTNLHIHYVDLNKGPNGQSWGQKQYPLKDYAQIDEMNDTGMPGDSFNPTPYLDDVPTVGDEYQYEYGGVSENLVSRFSDHDEDLYIGVAKPKSRINIHFRVNGQENDEKVVNGTAGQPFNIYDYLHDLDTLPSFYQYDIENNVDMFHNYTNDIYINIDPKQTTVKVNYFDVDTGKVIKSASQTGRPGENVNSSEFSAPSGYHTILPFDPPAWFATNDQTENVAVQHDKTIVNVHYIKDGLDLYDAQGEGKAGEPFDMAYFLNLAGMKYHAVAKPDKNLQVYPEEDTELNLTLF